MFDKFLPGMRTMAEKQPAALGFSVRKIIQFSGGAIPAEAADALDAALCALELYSAEPEMSDTPLTPDGAEVVPEPPRDAIYPGKVWRDTNGRRIQAHGGALYYDGGVYYWYGENKDHTDGKCPVWTWGMRAYRSTDLCNWEDLGLFIQPDLTDKDAPLYPTSRADRPHIVKCAYTGKYVCWIKHCPVCVSWQNRSVAVLFGHRLSDELSEIILDYLHFDHRLTTTVQWHYKMLEKPVVTTNNGLFLFWRQMCRTNKIHVSSSVYITLS